MKEIKDILLHREPFLFVDEITHFDNETIEGNYTYKESEFFFKGHFPSYPVVPGVLLVELMAQVGGAGLGMLGILPPGSLFVLGTIEKAKFRRQVRPLDKAEVTVHNDRVSSKVIRQSGVVKVNGEIAAEASWMCICAKEGV